MSTPSTIQLVGGMIGKSGEAGGSGGGNIPAGTSYTRTASSTTWNSGEVGVVWVDDDVKNSSAGSAFCIGSLLIQRLSTGCRITTGNAIINSGQSVRIASGGTETDLGYTVMGDSTAVLYQNTIGSDVFTAFKIVPYMTVGGTPTGSYDDNGGDYVTVPSVSDTVSILTTATANENTPGGITTNVTRGVYEIYGRATGYTDTLLTRIAFECSATSDYDISGEQLDGVSGSYEVNSSGLGNSAGVSLTVNTNGTYTITDTSSGSGSANFTSPSVKNWVTNKSSTFEMRWHEDITGDAPPTTTLVEDTWYDLTSSRTFIVTANEADITSKMFIQVRDKTTKRSAVTTLSMRAIHFP